MDDIENIIIKHLAGSHAYGTNIATSDVDYRGIFLCDKKYILSPFNTIKEISDLSEEDTKYFELNNFMKLFIDANPNILETLFVDEGDIVFKTELYDYLRKYNYDLLSSKVAFTYTGYAHNQATRMKNHHSWIDKEQSAVKLLQQLVDEYPYGNTLSWLEDNFPDYILNLLNLSGISSEFIRGLIPVNSLERNANIRMVSSKPLMQKDFIKLIHNYTKDKIFERDFNINHYSHDHILVPYGENIFGVVKFSGGKLFNNDGSLYNIYTGDISNIDLKEQPELIVKFTKNEYDVACDNRKSYHTWKTQRNEKRAELEKKNGYDCYLNSETEFLTLDGFKKYDDITENDYLGTVNPNSKNIEFQKYVDRVKKQFSGIIYHGECESTAFTVTGNHRMYIMDFGTDSKTWRYAPLTEILNGKNQFYHMLHAVENDFDDYNITDDFIRIVCQNVIHYNNEKKFHREFLELLWKLAMASLSKRQANIFIDELFDDNQMFLSPSNELLSSIQIIAVLAGRFSEIHDGGIYISNDDVNSSTVFDTLNCITEKLVTDDHIVCFTVPNENLITRNNGKIAIQGNTKHAMHVVRLLRTAEEILTTGEVHIKRPDAEELLAIRNGAWTYDEMMKYYKEKDILIRNTLYNQSKLPKKPNIKLATKIITDIREMQWYGKKKE